MIRAIAMIFLLMLMVCAARAAELAVEPTVLGDGAHRYQWVPEWLSLPEGVVLGGTHGCVAVDRQDRIFANTEGEFAVIIISADGHFVKGWGKDYRHEAHGMCLIAEGDHEVIWLAHFGRHEVVKFSLDGEVLQTIPWPKGCAAYASADEYRPTAVAVSASGDVYVADGYGKGWVHRFSAAGALIQSWNGSEGAAGAFSCPHGIGIDARTSPERVVVCDRENHRLQLFSLEGAYLGVVDGLRRPCKAMFHGDDLVVPDLQGRVTILDREYHVVAQLGDNPDAAKRANYEVPPAQWKDGEFTAPHGAAWDSMGNLYVEDWNRTGRISKLQRVK